MVAAAFGGKWLVERFSSSEGSVASMKSHADWSPAAGEIIDVREFKKTMTVEALNATAEHYFASVKNWDYLLAKPLAHVGDAPALLNNVAHLLNGLRLLPGMSVLDFGAGSCWLSRWLTQMRMEVIALDVSATALKIGEALYARQPVIGARPAPRFMLFDGHRIELPDASVDRIVCLDTFHHLLNPHEVLREMSRVLKPDGIAGFSEPGPRHSRSFQSQFEMRNFKVLEDDIHMDAIWSWARDAGFARLRIGVFAPHTHLFALSEFNEYLEGGATNVSFATVTRERMRDHRLFFLSKTVATAALDSRSRVGLAATLEVHLAATSVKEGVPVTARVVATNSGRALWLPRSAPLGAVFLGAHLLDGSGKMLKAGFYRHPLTPGDGRAIAPGDTVTVEVRLPALAKGSYILEFDLVSDSAGWFALSSASPVRVRIDVV